MFYATALVAAAALTGLVSAQNYSTTSSGALYITPDSVALSTRETWCSNQLGVCQAVCNSEAYPNNCSSTALTYDCKCTNKKTPNISDYENSLPFFICEQWISDCVDAHPNDLAGITACRAVTCGDKKAPAAAGSSASASASGSASASASGSASTKASSTKTKSGSGSGASSTSSSSSAATATALYFASNYGTPLLGAGALALFGLAL